jgi:hypothetical protein
MINFFRPTQHKKIYFATQTLKTNPLFQSGHNPDSSCELTETKFYGTKPEKAGLQRGNGFHITMYVEWTIPEFLENWG